MAMQSNQQNLLWPRSFSPVAESDSYPTAIAPSPSQQDQQQQARHSQSTSGSSPPSYDYYNQGGGVLTHEAPSFYPSPSYSTDGAANYPLAQPISSSSSSSSMSAAAVSASRHIDLFQGATNSCSSTHSPPYSSASGNNTNGGIHAFHPLLTTSTSIARPTARKVRAPYQRRQLTTSDSGSSESAETAETATNNHTVGASAPATASYHCEHPGCGKSFTRPYNLTSHMRTHTSERPFACSQCGRRFARQHDRNRHEKLHWNIKPYVCSNCSKPFARMDALNRHLKVENGCGSILAAAARSL